MFDHKTATEQPATTLRVHEWLAVALLIGMVGGIAIITSANPTGNKHTFNSFQNNGKEGIEVHVKGAVGQPGIYHFPSQVSVKDILDLAQANPEADLRKFNMQQMVQKNRVINIPARPLITIQIKGAVKAPKTISLPKGSSLAELIPQLEFEENADQKVLQKKRKLRAGETIVIPVKKSSLRE